MIFTKIDKTLYFCYDYNEIFSNEIITIMKKCDKIYFNNYDNHEICFETNNLYDSIHGNNWEKSIFNQSINNLPNSIIAKKLV